MVKVGALVNGLRCDTRVLKRGLRETMEAVKRFEMATGPAKRGMMTKTTERRKSAHARGYDRRWQAASKAYLARFPLCVECLFKSRTRPAYCVDHIIPHRGDQELFWEESNWCGLCWHHHSYKTAKEQSLLTWSPDVSRVVVCGLPASGKSYYAERKAQAIGCDVWDWDRVASEMGYEITNRMEPEQYDEMVAVRDKWISERGHDAMVVIMSRPLAAMLLASQIRGVVVHCACSEATRHERLKSRE